MNKKVLICDDDEGILEVAGIVLGEKGYEVEQISESDLVVDRVNEFNPDVVLLDLWMPKVSGEDLTKQLKGNPETAGIPVVIVSASMETQKIAVAAGADGFLCKPFNISDLEDVVDKFIEKTKV